MAALEKVSTKNIQEAARAWRQNDARGRQHWLASGPFRFLAPEPNMSLHDRIDELVQEISRLRDQK